MRAAYVVDREKVEIREIPKPDIAPDDVLVRVRCVGVCGSDLHLYNGTHAFRKWPAILGHEVAGEVAAIGAAVTKFAPGDRVTVNGVQPCGKCFPCSLGLTSVCDDKRVPGSDRWMGCFAEYFPAPESQTHKIADATDYATAVLVEPLAVVNHILDRVVTEPRKSIAVLGCGTIGMLTMYLARERGYGNIIGSDPVAASRELATKLIADHALDPLHPGFTDRVLALTGGNGADVTVVAAGANAILDQASAITRKGGDVVLVSMMTKSIPVNSYAYVFKEQRLLGAMVYNGRDFAEAVRMVDAGAAKLAPYVTHRFPLAETQKAMETLRTKAGGAIKVVVDVA